MSPHEATLSFLFFLLLIPSLFDTMRPHATIRGKALVSQHARTQKKKNVAPHSENQTSPRNLVS